MKRRILVGNSFQEIDYEPKEEVEVIVAKPIEEIKAAVIVEEPIALPVFNKPDMEDTKSYMLKYCVHNDIAVTGKMNKTEILEAIAEDECDETL